MPKAQFDTNHKEHVLIRCPGCEHLHVLTVLPNRQENGAGWGFNGDMERPTFTPSLLVRWGKYADPSYTGDGESGVCHSFITDGMIKFLDDCTHKLKGQTVELPNV